MRKYTQEQFEHYRRAWVKSRPSVQFMVAQLQALGFDAREKHQTFAPNPQSMSRHIDSGDIEVITSKGTRRVEVKQVCNHDFTCAEDWAFGPRFFIGNAYYLDKAKPQPSASFHPNKSLTHWAMVSVDDTRQYWEKTEVYQRERGNYDVKYWVPTDLVQFTQAIPIT